MHSLFCQRWKVGHFRQQSNILDKNGGRHCQTENWFQISVSSICSTAKFTMWRKNIQPSLSRLSDQWREFMHWQYSKKVLGSVLGSFSAGSLQSKNMSEWCVCPVTSTLPRYSTHYWDRLQLCYPVLPVLQRPHQHLDGLFWFLSVCRVDSDVILLQPDDATRDATSDSPCGLWVLWVG